MAKKNGNEDVIKMLEANREKALVMSKKVNPDYTLTAPDDFQKTADYIEKWTGEKAFLSDSPDLVNQNYIAAQYQEGKKNAADQGFWGELGGFLAQSVAGEIVLGTVEGFGYLLDVQHWGSQLMGGEGDYGNWLSDYMEEGKQWIREAAPIYQDPDNAGRSTWENMLHGDGWWAENGVSVASSLSILIPVAGWTRGVGLAGKGARYLSQGARVGKYGTTAAKGTKTVDKVMDIMPMMGESTKLAVSGIHKATVSRLIESQMEATAVFKEKYDHYMENTDLTEEEARKAAGEAAAFTYNWNWGAMLTDIPQYMLLGRSGKRLKSMLHAKKPGFIQNSKLLNKTKGLRSTGSTMFSEGLEESYQYIVSEEGKRIGDIQAGLVDPNDTTLGERLSKYSKEAELHTSALFGALGGGVFSAAGPKATQLMNKAFRKGEQMMDEKDLRAREMQDRFTRLAHHMDAVNQATEVGDEEAVFAAKGNLAFDMAKEAVLVNNWKQAREAMAQLKNATPEEKEAYELKENFGEFTENIDEWITHMDAAADMVDRAKSKYTYGLAEGIARLQFDKYMYDVQAPKLREKINSEMNNVIPNFDAITKDGNTAVELGIENQGIALAIKNLEQMVKNGKMPASDMEILKAQIAHTKEVLGQGQERFKTITTEGELTEDDRLALEAIEGGTADDAISEMAKLKLMELRNKKVLKELNYWTSNEGRRKFKRDRAEAHKKAKAEAKKAKDKAEQDASAQEVVDPYTSDQKRPEKKTPIGDLNVADVAKAINKGAKYENFATSPEDVYKLKKAVADYNQRQEADPTAKLDEEADDLEILLEDEVKFDEETEDEDVNVNVLDDISGEEGDIEVDPVDDLAKELEAAEAHEEIEAPTNVDELDAYRITDNYQEMQLSKIPGQLAWLSSNNPMGDPTKITDEQKALTSFLETPDSSITDLEVEFDFNREWIKNNPKEIYTRMMKALSQGQMPSDADIGYMPIQATFMEKGKPVEYRGFNMRMNLHDPSFFYRKDGSPKYQGVSEYQAKIAILHKKAIISQMLKGGTVTAKVNGKSKGSIINETTEEGMFQKNYVLQTVRKTADKINFLVGDKTGRYVTHNKMPRLSLGAKATPGAIYTEVSTANGSKFPLRLQINNVSTAEATIVHAMYVDLLENPQLINDTISEGIIKYIKETTDKRVSGMMDYLPNFEQMTYQELLNHLVYEGSRTIAHKDATLTHFVNIEKGGVKLPNVVQFGKTKMPAERLAHEKGKLEFINWMVENKRRQVDASRLGDATYKGYLNDNKILSTNVSTTPEGNIFIQPVVSYSTNMRVERSQEEQMKKASAETKEVALLSFKEDLAYELTKEGGPNAEIVADLKRQIKVLEGKTSTKKTDPASKVQPVQQTSKIEFEKAGKLAEKTQDGKVIGQWLLDNAKEGDTITDPNGDGYIVTSINKKGQVEISAFELNENGEVELLNTADSVRLITENKLKQGDLFKTGYTDLQGARQEVQYSYTSATQQTSEVDTKKADETKDVETKRIAKINEEVSEFAVNGITDGFNHLVGNKSDAFGDIRGIAGKNRGRNFFHTDTKKGKKIFGYIATKMPNGKHIVEYADAMRPGFIAVSVSVPENSSATLEDFKEILEAKAQALLTQSVATQKNLGNETGRVAKFAISNFDKSKPVLKPTQPTSEVEAKKNSLNSKYLQEFGIKWEDKPFPGDIIEYNGSYYKVDYSENQGLTGNEILNLEEDGLIEYTEAAEVYKNKETFDLSPWNIKKNKVDVNENHPTGPLFSAPLETLVDAKFTKIKKGEESTSIDAFYEEAVIVEPAQQASEVTSETASTVANTIKMFQTGIKTEDNGEIKVSTVESIELDEVAETPTKTAEEIIEEEVTTEEITEIAKEEGIQEEEVIEAVKEEVKKQINEKKITKPSTLLQKVGARIKKMFVNLMLAATIFNATGFTMNTSTEGSKTYDNTTVESLEVFDNVYKDQEAINKEGNLNVITESFSGTNENYLVVDKTGQVAHLFEGDSLVTTYEVGTGKNKGDEQTKTIIRDGKVMWQEGNKQTGAGIYTVGSQGTYKHSPSFTLQNERGISVPTVLHETLSDRKKLFENNNVEDNRMSYGCVNFQAKSLQDLGKRGVIKPGSKVFILPDNPSNKFQSVDGKVQFVSNNENVNRTLVKYEAQDIILKANGVNNIGKEFLTALSENKAELMQLYPTISNDTYNQITKIAYGIFGQESSFGTFGGGRGKLGYVKDEIGVFLGKDMSVGVTQMRLSSVNKKTREVFDINSMDDIKDDVTKASIATMSLLMDMYENQIPTSMKGDFKQLLPLGYSNRAEFSKAVKGNKSTYNNAYVNNVNKNGNKVTVFLGQTDKAPIPAAPSFKKSTKKQGVEAVVNFRNRKAHGVQESSKIQDYAEKLAKINATKIKQGKIDKNIDSSDFEENPC